MLTAIKQGNEAVVRSSLEINPELIHQSAQYGMTPLMNASMLGQTNILKVLIEYGADLNVKGKGGMTALMYAAFQNHVEVVQLLIASGADVTIRSDVSQPPKLKKKQTTITTTILEIRNSGFRRIAQLWGSPRTTAKQKLSKSSKK
eukprot:c17415_g1_i4.p1 GENE.c17415_g1_i4~~c17415_g1_i4.p1  ORF type:complete len:146 (+),score=25.66 c17415_g1_i4:32-469(+)